MTKMADISEAATFRNQLDALSIKFVADFNRGDAKACAEAYSPDALLMLPNAAPIPGRPQIAAGFQAAFDAGRVVSARSWMIRSAADTPMMVVRVADAKYFLNMSATFPEQRCERWSASMILAIQNISRSRGE
jgi:hypothetical protein